jgi:Zn-dependent protease
MKWSVRIARIAGIDLKIHFTFLLLLAWIGLTYYQAGGLEIALQGLLFVTLLFACVLLHELGHALTARVFGIRTPDITLLPIGGLARLERIPDKPRQELLIALAGPLVNVVIALVLITFLNVRGAFVDLEGLNTQRMGLTAKLATVNIVLALFNLLPAFPMDGGRILRALLAMRINYATATQIAAGIGQGIAVVLGIMGLFGNPLLLFIAIFVFIGARQEAAFAQLKHLSAGLPISEAMVTDVRTLGGETTLDQAADALLHTSQQEFPIVEGEQQLIGLLTRDDLIAALRKRSPNTPVREVMLQDLPALHPEDHLDDAFNAMQQRRSPALPVIDQFGKLVGLIKSENVGELMILRTLRHGSDKPWRVATT